MPRHRCNERGFPLSGNVCYRLRRDVLRRHNDAARAGAPDETVFAPQLSSGKDLAGCSLSSSMAWGLLGMRERAQRIGARLCLTQQNGAGRRGGTTRPQPGGFRPKPSVPMTRA